MVGGGGGGEKEDAPGATIARGRELISAQKKVSLCFFFFSANNCYCFGLHFLMRPRR